MPAGATHSDSYQVFLGPKRPELLSQYYPKRREVARRSELLAGRPDLLWLVRLGRPDHAGVLHFFYSIVGNYGIAIILLTVLVRGLMFPISYKQTQNMAKIQALKPEMDRINEKYKTDLQKKSQATQELYRKHSINPLGGCLPLFLQMPIFIGLVPLADGGCRVAAVAAVRVGDSLVLEPRGARHALELVVRSCRRLSRKALAGTVSEYFSDRDRRVMLVTQKMSMPPPANEQAAMQQKMMKYMMIFFGLMFYKVAAGLCLYLIVSSLWGIAERKLLPKNQLGRSGGLGRFERIRIWLWRQTTSRRWIERKWRTEKAAQGEAQEVS